MPFFKDYQAWVDRYDQEVTRDEIERIKSLIDAFRWQPRFLILASAPADGVERDVLQPSLQDQIYVNWAFLELPEHAAPSDLASLIAGAEQDFVIILDASVRLARHALFEFAFALQECSTYDLLYADEDEFDGTNRLNPTCKTRFDPVYAVGKDSIGVPAAFEKSLLASLVAKTTGCLIPANLIYELTLLLIKLGRAVRVHHIPAIIAHRHRRGGWDSVQARAFLQTHFEAYGKILPCDQNESFSRIEYLPPTPEPSVSIIIPTRDQPDFIRTVLDGLLSKTHYDSMQVIVIDNGTRDPTALQILHDAASDARVVVLRDESPFNYSRLNNRCAAAATGEFLVFLNNDIEVLRDDWLKKLIAYFHTPDIGIVGPKLIYPDRRIQHAGVVFGPDESIIQQFRLEQSDGSSSFDEVVLSRTVSSVTSACLAMRASVFNAIGHFDEKFPVGFNDIDLCRKAAEHGFSIIYAADVELVHHESVSRGKNIGLIPRAREWNEKHMFWKKHKEQYRTLDPFHNPNVIYGFFSSTMSWPPRRARSWSKRSQRRSPSIY